MLYWLQVYSIVISIIVHITICKSSVKRKDELSRARHLEGERSSLQAVYSGTGLGVLYLKPDKPVEWVLV